jgi:hypothetical protein
VLMYQAIIYRNGGIRCHAIHSTDSGRQLNATAHIRKVLLTGKYSTIQCVIDFGVVPRFVEFL